MQQILFKLNIPADLVISKRTDMYLNIEATQMDDGGIYIEYLSPDTHTLNCISVPMIKIHSLAKEVALKHFPAVPAMDNFSIMDTAFGYAEQQMQAHRDSIRVAVHQQIQYVPCSY